jgi:hypothetical protein
MRGMQGQHRGLVERERDSAGLCLPEVVDNRSTLDEAGAADIIE